jgi:ATP-dependent Clp protease ATP-binding subunit ClpC
MAQLAAESRGKEKVDALFLLFAIVNEGAGIGALILRQIGLTPETLEPFMPQVDATDPSASSPQPPPFMPTPENPPMDTAPKGAPSSEIKTPALDTFGRDLTALATNEKLDPVIGRESELRRLIQILCRRSKNNAVLIGEAGVVKPLSLKVLPRPLLTVMCPKQCLVNVLSLSTWPSLSQERNTVDNLKNALNASLMKSPVQVTLFSSLMNYTPSLALEALKAPWMQPISLNRL